MPAGPIDDPKTAWERRQGDITLLRAPALDATFTTYGGRHVDDYAVQVPGGEVDVLGRATWGGFDQRGRLLLAQDGRLLEWRQGAALRELADFNAQEPVAEPPPTWAREWPERR
jgi:hypothetical protein